MGPKQCFVFPPGYIHETYVKPQLNSECTVATTFQYNAPWPAKYIRTFMPRWMNSNLVWNENAAEIYAPYAQILQESLVRPTEDETELKKRTSKIMETLDADGNSFIDLPELLRYYREDPKGRWAQSKGYSWTRNMAKEERADLKTELINYRATDTLTFHDTDEDGKISHDELFTSQKQWNVLLSRYNALRKLNPEKKKSTNKARSIEHHFLKKYGCPAEGPCEELEALKKRNVRPLSRLEVYQKGEEEESFEHINGQGGGDDGDAGREEL